MQRIDGGVNAPKGYEASGIEAGIKYENRKDMALVFSTEPANVAGTFTTNVVKAAPVQWDAASYGTDPQRSTAFERCPDNGPPGGERCSQSHYDDGYDSERMCRYV